VKIRLRWAAATTALAAALISAGAATAGQISFYSNIGNPIGDKVLRNPLVLQPATLLMSEDGSWVIDKLHWTGWGTAVAHATGESVGTRSTPPKIHPAQITLSRPQTVLGHQVYSCFQLTIPQLPTANQHLCIGKIGSEYGYRPAGAITTTPPAGGATTATGATKAAIIARLASQPGAPAANLPAKCLLVRIYGTSWATVFSPGMPAVCGKYAANGVIVMHKTTGWHYVTAGSDRLPCTKLGIPVHAQRALEIPCG